LFFLFCFFSSTIFSGELQNNRPFDGNSLYGPAQISHNTFVPQSNTQQPMTQYVINLDQPFKHQQEHGFFYYCTATFAIASLILVTWETGTKLLKKPNYSPTLIGCKWISSKICNFVRDRADKILNSIDERFMAESNHKLQLCCYYYCMRPLINNFYLYFFGENKFEPDNYGNQLVENSPFFASLNFLIPKKNNNNT